MNESISIMINKTECELDDGRLNDFIVYSKVGGRDVRGLICQSLRPADKKFQKKIPKKNSRKKNSKKKSPKVPKIQNILCLSLSAANLESACKILGA
jgi:hypothetical protein